MSVNKEARRFDAIATLLGTWLLAGIFADGWAHNHIQVDSFFTPWHAVLYSGFLANAALFAWTIFRGRSKGKRWSASVPAGYQMAALGVGVFGVSGIGDMIWHLIFGIEVSVSAGFSPPHLGIMVGIGLIVSGPFVAAWKRRANPRNWMEWLPPIVSLALTFSLMTFVTQYVDPLVDVTASIRPLRFHDQAIGAIGILLHTIIMMSWILVAAKRWGLPQGSMTLIMVVNAAAMSLMRDRFFVIPAILAAGVGLDLLLQGLSPEQTRPIQFRVFAFGAPIVYFAVYFASVWITQGISWPVPLWTGSTVMAGIVSALVSLLIIPAAREVT